MTEYAKVFFEVDCNGRRLALSATDDNGTGDGYRIFGPKFGAITGGPVRKHELDQRDVEEIRQYLAIWDEIQARKAATVNAREA